MNERADQHRSSPAGGIASLFAGIAVVLFVGWWMLREQETPAPPVHDFQFRVPVTTVPVAQGDVTEWIELVGDVAAPERAELAFERAGRLRELPIRLGDEVRAGDVLARLDDAVMEEEVRATVAALAQARTMAELAERDAVRARELGDDVSRAALDRAESVARNEAARVTQVEADLALKRAELAQGTLRAPFDAIVTSRPLAVGDYVAAGDVCCALLSLDRREVLLEIPASVIGTVAPGASVELTSDELPGLRIVAPLAAILPSPTPRARTFTGVVRVAADADPQRRLQPGLFVRGRLALREARAARVVPVDTLREGVAGNEVARVVEGADGKPATAALVPVEVLARDALRAAVVARAGATLEVGDPVVLIGKENVWPGGPVVPAPPADPEAAPRAGAPATGSAGATDGAGGG